jgi:hypothetical protein
MPLRSAAGSVDLHSLSGSGGPVNQGMAGLTARQGVAAHIAVAPRLQRVAPAIHDVVTARHLEDFAPRQNSLFRRASHKHGLLGPVPGSLSRLAHGLPPPVSGASDAPPRGHRVRCRLYALLDGQGKRHHCVAALALPRLRLPPRHERVRGEGVPSLRFRSHCASPPRTASAVSAPTSAAGAGLIGWVSDEGRLAGASRRE